jgi:hypothetical protein
LRVDESLDEGRFDCEDDVLALIVAANRAKKHHETPETLTLEGFRRLVAHPVGHGQDDNVTLRGFDAHAVTAHSDKTLQQTHLGRAAKGAAPDQLIAEFWASLTPTQRHMLRYILANPPADNSASSFGL